MSAMALYGVRNDGIGDLNVEINCFLCMDLIPKGRILKGRIPKGRTTKDRTPKGRTPNGRIPKKTESQTDGNTIRCNLKRSVPKKDRISKGQMT